MTFFVFEEIFIESSTETHCIKITLESTKNFPFIYFLFLLILTDVHYNYTIFHL